MWLRLVTRRVTMHGGKPWRYSLVPHDVIAENMTLQGLTAAP